MKKMINQEKISGWIYEHDLSLKTVQTQTSANFGKPFISGTINVATDDEGLNVIPVHFTYVTEFTKTGAKNKTFVELTKIINEGKTWIEDGKDAATCVKINTALALNDFYTADDQLVSQKTNEGGFVTIISEPDEERATFTFDMVITSINKIEPDEDNKKYVKAPYISLRGCVFNFRNDVLPIEVVVENEKGIEYFEDQDISNSNPLFTKVWGNIISNTETRIETEESAFGEAAVKTFERKVKKWVVTGTTKTVYDFGDDDILTIEELTKGMQDREIKLAETKKRQEEYQAQKNNVPKPDNFIAPNSYLDEPIKNASFNF